MKYIAKLFKVTVGGPLLILYTILITVPFVAMRFILIALGAVVVPIALLFRKEVEGSEVPGGTKYMPDWNWKLILLPKWAWIWSNESDGMLGDKRGYWGKIRKNDPESFLSMYIWAAFRNPVNNLRYVPLVSCLVNKCTDIKCVGREDVADKVGGAGWNVVWGVTPTKFPYPGFYMVKMWGDTGKCLRIRIGWKLKKSYISRYIEDPEAEEKRIGFTFLAAPWKQVSGHETDTIRN